MNQNSMCDGSHCRSSEGEVRLLPTGGGGNMIVCHACYLHEMSYRRDRNRTLGEGAFQIPTWDSLEVYKGAE